MRFRDITEQWERIAVPEIGMKIRGKYYDKDFTGIVINAGTNFSDMTVIVKLDKPITIEQLGDESPREELMLHSHDFRKHGADIECEVMT